MTEPDVASSDATNVRCAITADGDDYVINGTKWYTTGGMRDTCELLIVMGKSDPDNPNRHAQQSMILVPKYTDGVRIATPRHHLWLRRRARLARPPSNFDNVRVPKENSTAWRGARL